MIRDLDQCSLRYYVADNSEIEYRGIDWPEFASFCTAVKMLEQRCAQVLPSREVSQILALVRHARRMLRSSPLHPTAESVGLGGLEKVDVSSASEEFRVLVSRCIEEVEKLRIIQAPPAWKLIEQNLQQINARDDRDSFRENLILIVHDAAVASTNQLAETMGWDARAMSLTQARKSDTGRSVLIFGSPELLTNWRLDKNQSSRAVAWLFSAPLALKTSVVCWPGASIKKFDISDYQIWGNEFTQNVEVKGPTQFHIDVARLEELRSGPDDSSRRIADLSEVSPDAVMATGFELINGQWIFYSNEFGPKPDFIEENEYADSDVISVRSAKTASEIVPGSVMVIRAGDAARAFLEQEAKAWCDEKREKGNFERAMNTKTRFREGLRNLRLENGLQKLKSAGLSEADARRRLNQIYDPGAIAPGERSEFELICGVIKMPTGDEVWDDIILLRTAMRQAGHLARKKLEDAIEQNQEWRAIVSIPEIAEVHIEGAGSALLAPVLAVHPNISVNISNLGVLK